MAQFSNISPKAKFTRKDIVVDLQNLGLTCGDHVAVSISYGEMGNIDDGPSTVLDSLLEVIGHKGTLMMPTYSYSCEPSRLSRDYVFDPHSSISYTGYVTELLRLHPSSTRSHHPTNSITAVGRYSDYLTKSHDEHKLGLLPYFRLTKIGGKYLSIGLDDRLLAIRHTGQVVSGLYSLIPFYYATQYRKPNNEVAIFYDYWPCPHGLISVTPILEKKGTLKRGKIGSAEAKIGKAKDIITEISRVLKKNPELTLCDKSSCIWCRMVEKKLDLYHAIPETSFYQYQFIREIVSLLNKIRISRYNHIMFRDTWKYPQFLITGYLYARALAHHITASKRNQIS